LPTRRFDGRDLEQVLEQVRDEVGPEAHIIEANRVRSGGIAGFFAKERFEVLVEEDPDEGEDEAVAEAVEAAGGAEPPRPPGPRTIEDLADEVSEFDQASAGPAPDGSQAPAPGGAAFEALLARMGVPPSAERDTAKAPARGALPARAADVYAEGAATQGAAAQPARKSSGRGGAARRARSAAAKAARDQAAAKAASNGSANGSTKRPAPARPKAKAKAGAKAGAGAKATQGPAAPAASRPRRSTTPATAAASPAATQGARPRRSTTRATPAAEPVPPPRAPRRRRATAGGTTGATAPAPAPSPASPAPAPAPAPRATEPAPRRARTSTNAPKPARTPVPAAPRRRRAGDRPKPVDETVTRTLERLGRLGLPDRLLPMRIDPANPAPGLLEALADLPVAAPAPALGGSVLAVVGDRLLALWLARQLAGELRLDPHEVMLAAGTHDGLVAEHLHLADPATTSERRRGWTRRHGPTVVVVEARPGSLEVPWARHMLAALEPTAVWGVVEASRKTEDVVAWSEDLGKVDALLVEAIGSTTSPAAILGPGIPVARLDGRPADPAAWAALLAARLTA
jgi:hypothetical protein